MKPADAQEVLEQEVGLNPSLAVSEKPIVDAKVVYLGSNPYMALSLKGRLIVESRGEGLPANRKATRSGREHYDFSTVGSDGLPANDRLMPVAHPIIAVRGKPYCPCAHIEHLYEFSQMRDQSGQPMFKIVGGTKDMSIIEDYVQRQLAAKRLRERFTQTVTS